MEINGIYIPAGKNRVATQITRPRDGDYQWNNQLVGCEIGTVVTLMEHTDGSSIYLWLDDEGLLQQPTPPLNGGASVVANQRLVGNAVLFKSDSEGEDIPMRADEIDFWLGEVNRGIVKG